MESPLYYQLHAKYSVPPPLKGELYSLDKVIDEIDNINKVNLFVGANNSGKSRLLREILKSELTPISPNMEAIKIIESEFLELREKILEVFKNQEIDFSTFSFRYSNAYGHVNTMPPELFGNFFSTDLANHLPDTDFINKFIASINHHLIQMSTHNAWIDKKPKRVEMAKQIFQDILDLINVFQSNVTEFFTTKFPFTRTYVPTVRFLREFTNKKAITLKTREEYGLIDQNKFLVQNGERFYNEIQEYQNGEFEDREVKKSLEKFLSEYFFNGKSIEITAVNKTDAKSKNFVHITIADEKEQPIHHLGDGIQMIIIMALPFFTHKCGIVAIEEPELFIHPGLQRQFLEFLLYHPNTKNFQIFIATHSNHFLDLSVNSNLLSIFNVSKRFDNTNNKQKLPKFNIENVASGDQTSLSLLGVNNSSVYLSNCTIWVEGVTDRLYLKRFIEEYLKNVNTDISQSFRNYFEGVHYAFVYSGGDSIVHWDFDDESEYEQLSKNAIVKNICGKAFVIVDNDFGKNIKRKEGLEKVLGHRLLILPVPEIENLLSQNTIIETLKEYPSIIKQSNLIKKITDKEVKEIKLGTLIDDYLLKDLTQSRTFSESPTDTKKSKSIRSQYKLGFCTKSLQHISFANMNVESKEIAEKIIEFVVDQNKNKSS